MKQLLYRLIYAPPVNALIRQTLKALNAVLPKQIKTAVSGVVSYHIQDKKFLLDTNESCYVSHKLFWDGAMSYEFTPVFIDIVPHCKSFFDVGANIGYFTVLASAYNPEIRSYAFEPSEGPYHFLKKNIELNRCRAGAYKTAIAGINGTIQFFDVVSKYKYLKYHLNGSSSTQNETGREKQTTYDVEAITLDDFIEKHNISSLDLMKMDTECTEHFILQKAEKTLTRFKPIIISEVYPEIEQPFEAEILKYDYLIFQYTDKGLVQIQRFDDLKYSYKSAEGFFDRNFFFIPAEKLSLFEKHIVAG